VPQQICPVPQSLGVLQSMTVSFVPQLG